jgi:N-acetylglucosamine kinase-like BadF-type ATPase
MVLGIDGGATKTRAVLVSESGVVAGYGEAGPSNYDNVGIEKACANIRESVTRSAKKAGCDPKGFDAAFLGMAGVVSKGDHAIIRSIAGDLGLAEESRIGIDHDIRTALAGGLAGKEGLALIVGTGSSCYGRRADGRNHRAGWGYLLDDVGSGYFLGLQAMIATIQQADGRGVATRLSGVVQDFFGYTEVDEIMHLLYHNGPDITRIASLAPKVIEEARSGDTVARRIVADGVGDLASMVATVVQKLGFFPDPCSLVLIGSVATESEYYRAELLHAIHHRVPHCLVRQPILQPVLGAALLALEQAGVAKTETILQNLSLASLI